LGEALAKIEFMEPPIDVVMPHMFDFKGMTRYRALIEMLNIEVLGNPPDVCSIGEDKFLTKAVCQLAGVPVPKAQLLRKETHGADVVATAKQILETRSAPFIVKPAREGNSRGVSLVKKDSVEEVATALSAAFDLHDQILLEEYIAGRECRVAVLEVEEGNDVQLMVLPKIEYVLDDIRDQTKKLGLDSSGQLLTGDGNVDEAIKKGKTQGERICPAQFDPEIHARLDDLGKRAHKALGCKYYSLYDVRIDKDGSPFMLESCLFCSFSPWSIIVGLAGKMEGSDIQQHPKLFEKLLCRAAAETRARRADNNNSNIAC
jgi:D-alanine-D-alanine ligase